MPKILIVAYRKPDYREIAKQLVGFSTAWVYGRTGLNARLPEKHIIILTRSAKEITNFEKLVQVCVDKNWQIIDLAC